MTSIKRIDFSIQQQQQVSLVATPFQSVTSCISRTTLLNAGVLNPSTNKLINEQFTTISTLAGREINNKDQLVNVVPSFRTPAKAVLLKITRAATEKSGDNSNTRTNLK